LAQEGYFERNAFSAGRENFLTLRRRGRRIIFLHGLGALCVGIPPPGGEISAPTARPPIAQSGVPLLPMAKATEGWECHIAKSSERALASAFAVAPSELGRSPTNPSPSRILP